MNHRQRLAAKKKKALEAAKQESPKAETVEGSRASNAVKQRKKKAGKDEGSKTAFGLLADGARKPTQSATGKGLRQAAMNAESVAQISRKGKRRDVHSEPDASRIRAMRTLVKRLAAEFNGNAKSMVGLRESDVDVGVLKFLAAAPHVAAESALREFAALPAQDIRNRPAMLFSRLRVSLKGGNGGNRAQNLSKPVAGKHRQPRDILEKFTVSSASDPPSLEMAVGAIVCDKGRKDEVVACLPSAWQRHHVKGMTTVHIVTSCSPQRAGSAFEGKDDAVAIHLSPEGAAALQRHGVSCAPPELAKMLSAGDASFCYGLRAGSSDCPGQHRAEILGHTLTIGRPKTSTNSKFRYVELFAGIGGFRIALDELGGHCVLASEIDSHARKTYAVNFEETPAADINDIDAADVPAFDILTAGFPCQPFSIAGAQEGVGDPKGVLFLEVTRLLHSHRPAAFILENVPQMEQLDGGRVMKTIVAECEAAGYTVLHRVLSSRPVVPQRRQRVYLVGFDRHRGGESAASSFRWPSWADDADKDQAEYSASRASRYSTSGGALPTELERGWPIVSSILEPPDDVWAEHELTSVKMEYLKRQLLYWNHDLEYHFVNERGAARTLIGSYLKLGRSDQLVAPPSSSTAGKNKERRPRLFTPRECCRLMGFPEWFKVLGEKRSYHEFGNAVCPPVVKAIAECILATGIVPVSDGLASSAEQKAPRRSKKRKSVDSLPHAHDEDGVPKRRRKKKRKMSP